LCARHAPRAASGAAADEEDEEEDEDDEADAGARKRRTDASQLPVASVAASSHASDEMPSVGEESASGEPREAAGVAGALADAIPPALEEVEL
jgi:hypothetical protein